MSPSHIDQQLPSTTSHLIPPVTATATNKAASASQQQPASDYHQEPLTPPPTPTTGTPPLSSSPSPAMFELTRSKLERAAQGQSMGRRGSGGLRELVLLSNVFGASRPQRLLERDDELQQRQIEQRRKQEEEQWLNSVLDEMLEEEEEDDDFQMLTLRNEGHSRPVDDSGFLEQVKPHHASTSDHASGAPVSDSLDSIAEDEEAIVKDDMLSSSELQDANSLGAPSSPPLPPRSPPIDVPPERNTRPLSCILDDNSYSSSTSPPLHPPPLTPDSTPPGQGLDMDLASSADSVASDLDDSFHWISTQRGLLALDLSPPCQKRSKPGSENLVSASLLEDCERDPSIPAGSDQSTSLALTLRVRPTPCATRASVWLPAPGRPLSTPHPLPRQSRRSTLIDPSALHLPFSPGAPSVVKSFYDCVDFGRPPTFTTTFSSTAKEHNIDDDGAHLRGRPSNEAGTGTESSSLALVLANPARPLLPQMSPMQTWRSRSLSPRVLSRGRSPGLSPWSGFADLDDDGHGLFE